MTWTETRMPMMQTHSAQPGKARFPRLARWRLTSTKAMAPARAKGRVIRSVSELQ